MSYANIRDPMKQYTQVGAQTGVVEATPHRLIQMLLEGALDKIAIAKGHMARGNIAEKGSHISWAISIISGLRAALNQEAGGELATRLDDLYEYMEQRLLEANLQNNAEYLDEVGRLLGQIKAGWDGIADVANQQHAQQQAVG